MKIGVCFKVVPDYEGFAAEEWTDVNNLDFTYAKKVYGCFDESALELALDLRDSLAAAGKTVELVAVTAGVSNGAATDGLLRGVLAAGFEDVVILPYTEQFQPQHTARALASYFKKNPVDLILTGRMVGAGDSGMVPVYLAEELGFALFFDAVSGSVDTEDGMLKLVCKDGGSLKTFAVPEGSVCTVGDSEKPYLRLFPMKARMAAMKKTFSSWDEIEGTEPLALLLRNEQTDSACQYFEQMEVDEIAARLIQFVKEAAE